MSAATAEETRDQKKEKDKKKHPRDPVREVVETVVFVVVLVLLLKLFVTEAFVIPTGSMAETLYGYQKIITCPKCGHTFPINSHGEVEGESPPGGGPKERKPLVKYVCPNCRHHGLISDLPEAPKNRTGDRVLVLKPLYHVRQPERGDVVVFKFPAKPQEAHVASNYIKRAMGFGGETVAIHRGDLFVTTSLGYPENDPRFPRPADPNDLWRGSHKVDSRGKPLEPEEIEIKPDGREVSKTDGQEVQVRDYRYRNSDHATALFAASRAAGFPQGVGGFEIVRKPEDQLLADLRIVWDNDKQPKDLVGVVQPRWYERVPEGGQKSGRWKEDNEAQPRAFAHSGDQLDWIHYRHLAMTWKTARPNALDPSSPTPFEELRGQKPWYIDNFLGYNASRPPSAAEQLWVGDLALECEIDIAAESEVILELSKGPNRFQAKFGNGQVSLKRVGPKGAEFGEPSRPCKVNGGTYKIRFANIDCRLWVWVDGKRIDFGAEGDYSPVEVSQYEPEDAQAKEGWTRENDIERPASIGAKGPVAAIRAIKLHRDIYYTWGQGRNGDQTQADIFYVHPGHYMCLGDNSAHSSDSREWGMVPDRLMLGKAVFVFWPAYPSPNRVGFIK